MNLAEYYKLQPLNIADIMQIFTLQKVKQEEIIDGKFDLESVSPDPTTDIVIITYKNERYLNGNLSNLDFYFSEPLNVLAVGVPQQLNNEQVIIQRIDLNVNSVVGFTLVKKDLPFIIIYSDKGTKILSMSDLNPPKPVVKNKKRSVKKRKRKSKKRAKKSSSKSQNKSKSVRKG
ncbi:hypothetical protein BFU36_01965 [Sulfolobus sp. A20]|nr:hypothetical protein BFU36_01965 [Sulfolobus sp. A20]TRM78260.1 hypothetical protein DJ532_01545 [Sulfolobus sp. A20-N-F8]TRM78938.1 hypothetical protein DJ528_03505 [Sulfolobus sp. B5]TRM85443.1 hypothetical protein DJ522_00675 [Sulfolobus sp. F3]TRM88517.1 hypothetical protein DJ529_05100 [Sulfolobus sp. C3]TRM91995.1 hypothetical protein DJ526_06450 [Sulfolobus sp. A20-N-G8]TRM98018.1 hypothetical protein DMP16_00700 [Sulfolobus sp. B1]TRM99935.1 hypothetical protein DJ527_07825 [Sulfo